MEHLLTDTVAIVTGGTSGIGKAIALQLAEQGAKVAIFGQNLERGESTCLELQAINGKESASFHPVNVANKEAVDSAIENVLAQYGNVNLLVNNAGITRDKLLMRMGEEDWDVVMETNVKSCYNVSRALMRPMMKARSGRIINVSSVVALTGNAGQVNYAASKAGMIGFTKALAKEVASRGILVNCIAPGYVKTPMTDAMTEAQKQATLQQIPLGRIGDPEDIAKVALFLASPLANYITGQVLTVDGGMVI